MDQVGPALRRLRRQRGMTQEDLAAASGVAQDTISQIELGKREPYATTLRKLAGALDVPVAALFEGGGQEVIDLAHEYFGGAQEAVANASPQERQRLVEQDREVALGAIRGWMHQRTEMMWWFVEASIGRYVTVYRVADGDFLDLVNEVNLLWREVVEEQIPQ
jgi:transcriptional regulator with XRE-family HTH domain